MRYLMITMIMVMTGLDPNIGQAATSDQRESLRGLPGVGVFIEEIPSDAQADGLSVEEIRTAVELILRSSRIQILTPSERIKTPSAPYLYVRVGTFKSKITYSLCIDVFVKQRVTLFHRPQREMAAPTWDSGLVGISDDSTIEEVISILVEPQIKKFVNDFLVVNPR